jgi:hypothetical protein
VSGYATVFPRSGSSSLKSFMVHISHDPGQQPEWNFRVSSVEIDP